MLTLYSRISMARTLMARLPWLFRNRAWVSRKKSHSCRFEIILVDFPFYSENGILYVLNRIASMRLFYWEHTKYLHVKENRENIPIMPPDLALWLTLIRSNYPCLEYIFMVPKMFEPLKFYCIFSAAKLSCKAPDKTSEIINSHLTLQ